jgi:membrane protein involved in colicin uptake
MAAKKNKAYLKQEFIISVILAIIPITNIILGVLYRLDIGNT